jgi:choline kinase
MKGRPSVNTTRLAVILAAGIGSRLRPLTDDRPKALVEVSGETIIARAVRLLASYGVEKVILATGYRHDALERALAGARVPVLYRYNPEFETTQNSVSLALCADAVNGEPFFKLDGDVLFLPAVLERLDQSVSDLAVAVDPTRVLDGEAMKVTLDDRGKIRAFGKQIPAKDAFAETMGIERIGREAVALLFSDLGRAYAEGRKDVYYEEIYNEVIAQGLSADAIDISDLPWTEVDTFEDLAHAEALVRRWSEGPSRL